MKTLIQILISTLFGMLLIVGVTQAQTFDDYELDTTVPSFSNAYTLMIPGDLLKFSSIQRSPNNITMTNNWEIFTADGIALDTGDVLLIADYYADVMTFNLDGVTEDATALEIAQMLADVQTREAGELTGIIAGNFEGYQFDTVDASGLILNTVVIDVFDNAFMTFVLVTTTQAEQDNLRPLLIDIIASIEQGVEFDRVSAPDLELPETYMREADGFTMPYPEDWSVDVNVVGQSQFVTVTMGHTFGMDTPPGPGQPSAIIAYGTMENLTGLPASMLSPETNAIRVVQMIKGAQINDITSLRIKGLRAAQVIEATPNFDNWFVAIMLDEQHFVAANMFTAPQSDEDFFGTVIEMISESTWDAVAEAATTASAMETFTSVNSGLSLQHPVGWSGFDISSEIVVLINVDEAFAKVSSQDAPDSGQVVVTIFTHKLMSRYDVENSLESLADTPFLDDVDELEETDIDGRIVYMGEGQIEGADKLIMLVPIDENYVLVSALTAIDELEESRELLVDLALSIHIDAE